MSFFAELKQRASAELDAIKSDAHSIEEKIDVAFHLGAVKHALHIIESAEASVEWKLMAAFIIGKQSAAPTESPVPAPAPTDSAHSTDAPAA